LRRRGFFRRFLGRFSRSALALLVNPACVRLDLLEDRLELPVGEMLDANTAGGTVIAALLFAALLNGTSVRNLDPSIFEPQLASNLTYIIQGLIVLFVSAPVLVTVLTRGRWRRKEKPLPKPEVVSGAGG
jgi:hypothetical protein